MSIASDFPELIKSGFASYRKTTEQNDFNETVDVWPSTPHISFDGVLRQLTGSKRYVASIHGYDADYRLYIDAPLDVQPGDRVAFEDRRFEVKAVNDVMELGEILQIDMLWVSNDGSAQAGS
jgi:head-tail adaptor